MRRALSGVSRSVAVLAVLVGGAGRAGAGPLNPGDFIPVGPFPTAGGTYTIDTSGTPTLTGPSGSGISISGVVYSDVPGHQIAVFDFNAITLGGDQVFVGAGALPLALLSRGDVTINGKIDVSGSVILSVPPSPPNVQSPGGPGGGSGGVTGGFGVGSDGGGPGGGGHDGFFGGGGFAGDGGGGFGGGGGHGKISFGSGGPGDPGGLGRGGRSYGDLALLLQGGAAAASSSAAATPPAPVAAAVRLRSAQSVGSQLAAAASWPTALVAPVLVAPLAAVAAAVVVASCCTAIQ